MFCTVLIRKLQHYLKHINDNTITGAEPPKEFLLWLMFIGGIVTPHMSTRNWFVSGLSHVAKQLQLHTWDEVKAVLEEFFWVEGIQEQPGRDLWDEVEYRGSQDER